MAKAILKTDFHFDGQKDLYVGKVRDVYNIDDNYLVMVVSDRISAFDVVLPKGIPYKGQVLNQIASKFLDATADICPNWKIASPDPMVTVGQNISKEEIIRSGLVSKEDYEKLEKYALELFARGTEIAAKQGLILVDTKYEFGKKDGEILLMDEIHTPDSSRYFYADGYQERFDKGEAQRQLSKEFVREWLMEHGFQGRPGEQVPEMTDEFVTSVSDRYIELYEHITGEKFVKDDTDDILDRIENNTKNMLARLK